MATPFNSIEEAIKDIKKGKFIILVDDEDRENEGDLVMAAGKVTPQAVNFMAKHARGLICLALTPERVEELQLTPQAAENTATFGTAFTVSIDARKGITTGISAADRATTIHVAIDPRCTPADLARPGHIFPLKAQVGGVRMFSAPGTHHLQVGPTGQWAVDVHSTLDAPSDVTLYEFPLMRRSRVMEDNAALGARLATLHLHSPEFLRIPLPNGNGLDAGRIRFASPGVRRSLHRHPDQGHAGRRH